MTIRMLDENRCPHCRGWHDNTCVYENKPCPNIPTSPEDVQTLTHHPDPFLTSELLEFDITVVESHPSVCLLDKWKCFECREATLKKDHAVHTFLYGMSSYINSMRRLKA
jgi:hypothetical protein